MALVEQLVVSVQDCIFEIRATPPAPPPPPGTSGTLTAVPQRIARINAKASKCAEGSIYGCNVTPKFSKAVTTLSVAGQICMVELDVTPVISGDCAELQCKLRVFEPRSIANPSVSGGAGGGVGPVTLGGSINVNPLAHEDFDFAVSVCCTKGDGGCVRVCALSNPPDGAVL